MNVALLGKHANRTPLAYASYVAILPDDIRLVPSVEEADVVIVGFDIDLLDLPPEQHELLVKRADIRVLVISEEPLWDTLWASDYLSRTVSLPSGIRYECYNHFNSNVFKFEKIPYFLTTSNDFLVRWRSLLQANRIKTGREISQHWSSSQYKGAFFLERRDDQRYAKKDAAGAAVGLSCFRSEIAAACYGSEQYLIAGKGWDSQKPRQSSPDWHLEKINECKHKTAVLMAMENTCHPDYITEKVFDAHACLAVPLIYAGRDHRYTELLPNASYVNLAGLSPEEAFDTIDGIVFDDAFVDRYQADINALLEQTLTTANLVDGTSPRPQ